MNVAGKKGGLRFNLADLPDHIRRQAEKQLGRQPPAPPDGLPKKVEKPAPASKPEPSPPHEILYGLLSDLPGIEKEFEGAVPGRRFRLDIAFPSVKLAVEIDGWQYHGKYKEAHAKDRERQNLLVMNGWSVLRFSAGQVFSDPKGCALQIVKKIFLDILSHNTEH